MNDFHHTKIMQDIYGVFLDIFIKRRWCEAYLHLFEVTHRLDGQFSLDRSRWVPRLQLDNGVGFSLQAFQVSFELCQLLFLILQRIKSCLLFQMVGEHLSSQL